MLLAMVVPTAHSRVAMGLHVYRTRRRLTYTTINTIACVDGILRTALLCWGGWEWKRGKRIKGF
jgi:hypothetical protein